MNLVVFKGQWWRLPSGRVAEVRRTRVLTLPQAVDAAPGAKPGEFIEAVLRYLDDDGAMAAGEFHLSCAFLLKHGKHVQVAPQPVFA